MDEVKAEAEKAGQITEVDGTAQTFNVNGDVNYTGLVDINDAQLLMDILAGRYSAGGLEPDKLLAADVNGDGVVDELDLKMILSMIETKLKGVK